MFGLREQGGRVRVGLSCRGSMLGLRLALGLRLDKLRFRLSQGNLVMGN